jgi:hypothetical protein
VAARGVAAAILGAAGTIVVLGHSVGNFSLLPGLKATDFS